MPPSKERLSRSQVCNERRDASRRARSKFEERAARRKHPDHRILIHARVSLVARPLFPLPEPLFGPVALYVCMCAFMPTPLAALYTFFFFFSDAVL